MTLLVGREQEAASRPALPAAPSTSKLDKRAMRAVLFAVGRLPWLGFVRFLKLPDLYDLTRPEPDRPPTRLEVADAHA